MKKKPEEYVKKSEVLLTVLNYIRDIQMNDYGSDSGIPQLWRVYDRIEKIKGIKDKDSESV